MPRPPDQVTAWLLFDVAEVPVACCTQYFAGGAWDGSRFLDGGTASPAVHDIHVEDYAYLIARVFTEIEFAAPR
jgi:hypothetical protein